MAWFKVDDQFGSHPKVMQIPRAERHACLGLWLHAGVWAAQHLTDGHVPDYMLEELGAELSHRDRLCEVGLWSETGEGIVFKDWPDHQPTRSEVMAAREKERLRKEAYRAKKAANTGQSPDGTPSDGDAGHQQASGHPDPARPDPAPYIEEPKGSSTSETAEAIRPDVKALLDLLDTELRANDVKKLPIRNKANVNAMRLLVDKDGYDAEQVARIIRWCQADSFWRGNVMSAGKLREQFETLRAHANRKREERLQSAPSKSERAHEFMDELTGGSFSGQGDTTVGGDRRSISADF